ncbi:hypothetical protein [Acetobacter sp. DsW_063]|uniref:hypothetical protein n=1 Tax=Acetobacter sp. DsW_063 TaxID=1514894 RepID=UPI000A368880|nr:hypothetical protein [Acetobacter sp. DsW_063]OUJ15559.1 hypothetical protein HK28_07170 [Acetobacter sp. DsW_063]
MVYHHVSLQIETLDCKVIKKVSLVSLLSLSACFSPEPINDGSTEGIQKLRAAETACVKRVQGNAPSIQIGQFTAVSTCDLDALNKYGKDAFGEYVPAHRRAMMRELDITTLVDTGRISIKDAQVLLNRSNALLSNDLGQSKDNLIKEHQDAADEQRARFSAAMANLSQSSLQAQQQMNTSAPASYTIQQNGPFTNISGSDGSSTTCNRVGTFTNCTHMP